MKQMICRITLLVLAINFAGLQGWSQGLSIEPSILHSGATITLTFDPQKSDLKGTDQTTFLAMVFDEQGYKMHDVELRPNGEKFVGTFALPAGATAVAFAAANEKKGQYDINGVEPLAKVVMDANGKPLKHAQANLATYLSSLVRRWRGTPDHLIALDLLEKEIAAHPDLESQYAASLAGAIKAVQPESFAGHVQQTIQKFMSKKKANEKDFMAAYALAQVAGDEQKMNSIEATIKKKYPKGDMVKNRKIESFYAEDDLDKMMHIEADINKTYGNDPKMAEVLEQMAGALTEASAAKGRWDLFETYSVKVKNPSALAGSFNNLAWEMTGEDVNTPAKDLVKAKMLSGKSLELLEKAKTITAPFYYSPKQWLNSIESSYGMYADTYALILYKEGDYAGALKYQKSSIEKSTYLSPDMESRYAIYLAKAEGGREAEKTLETMILENKASEEIKKLHREIFLKNNDTQSAYDKYVNLLSKEANRLLEEEVKKTLIDEEAPVFSLSDLNGQPVSSESIKNKVVILDFWATWCGPCKQSFPGMQKLVDKYKNDPDVEFLFVDCWENSKDKLKNAQDFVQKNNYTFRVLMDDENKVVSDFKVEGVPTKFVVGPNGRVRHKSVGFGGNTDKMVEEMSIVIEVLKKEIKSRGNVSMK